MYSFSEKTTLIFGSSLWIFLPGRYSMTFKLSSPSHSFSRFVHSPHLVPWSHPPSTTTNPNIHHQSQHHGHLMFFFVLVLLEFCYIVVAVNEPRRLVQRAADHNWLPQFKGLRANAESGGGGGVVQPRSNCHQVHQKRTKDHHRFFHLIELI